jgi:hypothetical protein
MQDAQRRHREFKRDHTERMKRERMPERNITSQRPKQKGHCKGARHVNKSPSPALVVILYGNNLREKTIFRRIESETTVRQNMGRTL